MIIDSDQYSNYNKINIMDQFNIEASLKKIDRRFTQQLSNDQKKHAFHQFKKVYAQQMAKIASEISKRQKVQQNLNNINERQVKDSHSINQEINKKMSKHEINLGKHKDNKIKEFKMLDENWRKKLEDIQRKKKIQERQAFQETQKIRKQAEEYWRKKQQKNQFNSTNKDQVDLQQSKGASRLHQYSLDKTYLHEQKTKITKMNKTSAKKISLVFPDLQMNKTRIDRPERMVSQSLDQEIKIHKERCNKTHQEKQEQNFQKIMSKLDKIENTRKTVQARVQKEITQSKRLRQLRQNPERIALNRQKSIDTFASKSKSPRKNHNNRSKSNLDNLENSKNSLDNSISKRLETKKKIVELQFQQRQNVYESKLKKIKNSKINRLIKEAINYIKHQTLQNTD